MMPGMPNTPILIIILCTYTILIASAISVHDNAEVFSPHFKECFDLAYFVDYITPSQCVYYTEIRQNATGDEILNFYKLYNPR